MAFKNLIAFGAGEITPELAERDNLDKFKTGLKTLRNTIVTKYAGLKSRVGSVNTGINTSDPVRFHHLLDRSVVFEFGIEPEVFFPSASPATLKFRVHYNYNTDRLRPYQFGDTTSFQTVTVPAGYPEWVVSDLDNMHFTNDDTGLYIACDTHPLTKITLIPPGDDPLNWSFITSSVELTYKPVPMPIFEAATKNFGVEYTGFYSIPTGYPVQYGVTYVKNGSESDIKFIDSEYLPTVKIRLPIATNEGNRIRLYIITTGIALADLADEVRFYRRPEGSGAWGFVALGLPVANGGGWDYIANDVGQEVDLTNQPPQYVSGFTKDPIHTPSTVSIYQNRLLINGTKKKNMVLGSRTDDLLNMYRDFPLQDDSAVSFHTGSAGSSEIARFYDLRGLLIATNVGIYETPSDILKYDTAFAIKKSSIVHNRKLPIIGMGSAAFTCDTRLSGVFRLKPSGDNYTLETDEVSIFSGHFFEGHELVDWVVQDDGVKTLWCVRDDGVLLSFTYQEDQQLQSWARHDILVGKFKQVMTIKFNNKDLLLASVETEITEGNKLTNVIVFGDRNENIVDYIATDNSVVYKNQFIPEGFRVILTPTVDADYSEVTMTYSDDSNVPDFFIFSNTQSAVGDVVRMFNPITREPCDYEITSFNGTGVMGDPYTWTAILVSDRSPIDVFDWQESVPFNTDNMYQTFKVLDGLTFLEGQKLSVRVDGKTEASPLNVLRDYNEYTVSGGEIELEELGAIISVGLPIVSDIQTLDSQSIEQVSGKTESSIVNKLFVSYYKSRGLYVASDFPADNTNSDMQDHEDFFEPDAGIEPYQPIEPYSRREEIVITGDWSAASSTAFRNVDPQPVGVRGFLLDEEKIGG